MKLMANQPKALVTWLCSALCGLVVACGSVADLSGTGIISFGITDAPVDDAENVIVEISEIVLIGDGEPVSLLEGLPRQVDLLALQGGIQDVLIDGVEVPAGEYSEVRLKLNAVPTSCNNLSPPYPSFITIDGVQYPLAAPSGNSSGVKIKGAVNVALGEVNKFVIDFDLRQSIAERGAKACYNLKPVLRVVEEASSGAIFGQVAVDLLQSSSCTANVDSGSGAAIYVYQGSAVEVVDIRGEASDPFATATLQKTDEGFEYTVSFLPAGDYTAALTCQAGDDRTDVADVIEFSQVQSVAVSSGSQTQLDFTAAGGQK